MTDKIRAPWAAEQVTALNRFQAEGGMHPFTCGNAHPPHLNTALWATTAGWRCNIIGCDYEQDWVHAFMADPRAWPKPLEELRAAALPACIHPERYDGECPCPPNCGCCKATAATPSQPGIRHTTATITAEALAELYDDLDRYEEVQGEMNERAINQARELAALRQVARGYCPACGRGDAAPTVADWEQQKARADRAEELLRNAHDAGPDVADCAAADRNWDVERAGE